MNYPAYPKYKQSGIKWLGHVPEHWEVKRLRYVCRFAYGDSLASEDREDGDVSVYGSNGPVGCHVAANTRRPVIVVGRKGSYGKVNFSSREVFAIDTTYFIDDRFTATDLRWLFYALGTLGLDAVSKDSAVPGLAREDAYAHSVATPPPREQRAIADFLDRETVKIDTLVAKKRALIEKLKERRTALISRTVTRGLNPNAKLKPSDIDWLGDVPEHWNVKPLRRLAMLKSGMNITSEELEEGGEYLVFGGNGIRGYSSRFTHDGSYVLIGRQGALCGNINYASGQFWASEHAVVVSPLTVFATTWMGELLRAMNLNQYSLSAAQPGLSVERILALRIPVPPVPEQHAIADYLDRETTKIDGMAAKVETAIERLQEYRMALITAAVTGKIDVRRIAT